MQRGHPTASLCPALYAPPQPALLPVPPTPPLPLSTARYVSTPAYVGHERDPSKRQQKESQARQDAVRAVVKLQARMAPDNKLLEKRAPAVPVAPAGEGGAEEGANPFLAPTLWEDQPAQPIPAVALAGPSAEGAAAGVGELGGTGAAAAAGGAGPAQDQAAGAAAASLAGAACGWPGKLHFSPPLCCAFAAVRCLCTSVLATSHGCPTCTRGGTEQGEFGAGRVRASLTACLCLEQGYGVVLLHASGQPAVLRPPLLPAANGRLAACPVTCHALCAGEWEVLAGEVQPAPAAAAPLFVSWDWKAHLQKKARLAVSGG